MCVCLRIFIIMDFIAVNNSSDKYKMSYRGKRDKHWMIQLLFTCRQCYVWDIYLFHIPTIWLRCSDSLKQLFLFFRMLCASHFIICKFNIEHWNFVFQFSFSHNFTVSIPMCNAQISKRQNCRCKNINFRRKSGLNSEHERTLLACMCAVS